MAETPREILAAWSDRDDMADCILRDLDQQGYAIVPKEPTSIMCMTGERAGMTWLAECKADITVREARPTQGAGMTGYQEAVCDLMAENGNLRAEIERLRKAIEYACHSLDLGRITSTVASELRAAVGQATMKDEK